MERSRLLAQLTDELETVKAEMEERGLCEETQINTKFPGSSMTDGSPLVSIRRSLARVRSEITGMDVRIGVVEHSLLQVHIWTGGVAYCFPSAIYLVSLRTSEKCQIVKLIYAWWCSGNGNICVN